MVIFQERSFLNSEDVIIPLVPQLKRQFFSQKRNDENKKNYERLNKKKLTLIVIKFYNEN